MDELHERAERLELEATAKRYIVPDTPKKWGILRDGNLADKQAAICRREIQRLAQLLHS